MTTERVVIPGIVKNGVVVPQTDTLLPDGAHVEIVIGASDVSPALQAEFAQWEQLSDDAWAMIDQWEAEPSTILTKHDGALQAYRIERLKACAVRGTTWKRGRTGASSSSLTSQREPMR